MIVIDSALTSQLFDFYSVLSPSTLKMGEKVYHFFFSLHFSCIFPLVQGANFIFTRTVGFAFFLNGSAKVLLLVCLHLQQQKSDKIELHLRRENHCFSPKSESIFFQTTRFD